VATGIVVDDFDEPVTFRVRGMDGTNPEGISTCVLEARPGGNAVFRIVDRNPVHIPQAASNYLTPQEAEAQQKERAAVADEREKDARRMEREAREAEQREAAAAKAAKQAARS
jgi:hypothetical protein